jgi:hypothetical protein
VKKDPFAGLSGLDQQLFRQTKQRNNQTTLPRTNESTTDRFNERTWSRANESSDQRSVEATSQRSNEATRPRAAPLKGQELNRVSERHSHDIFHDQVRWLNRAKLEIDERYGRRVTVNGLVQLALDVLRKDYELNKARSIVVRVLVRGGTVEVPTRDGDGPNA